MEPRRRVAVFDAGLPPGLAFIRSLGRAGVPVAVYGDDPRAMSRFSKYATEFHWCPSVHDTDRFVGWLADQLASGAIDLVAPTSDYVAFNTSEASARVGAHADTGQPPQDRLLDCLFKNRFAAALELADFPTPLTATPTSIDEAVAFGEAVGYPVVAKPRSHVAVGTHRGGLIRSADVVKQEFGPFRVSAEHSCALNHDADVAWPMLQAYLDPGRVDVISVTGCLDRNGRVMALGHSKKTHQWPPRLGVGTQFEALGAQPFTDRAVAVVQQVLGSGIFELEVLLDRRTDEFWAIDLNPRGFGQMALDISRGNDLPVLWYRSVTGECVSPSPARRRPPRHWRMGIQYYTGVMVKAVRGPGRRSAAADFGRSMLAPRIGPVLDWRDARPAVAWARTVLRHPGGLVRPFLTDREMR